MPHRLLANAVLLHLVLQIFATPMDILFADVLAPLVEI